MGEGEAVSRTSGGNGRGRGESDGDGGITHPQGREGRRGLRGEMGATEMDGAALRRRVLIVFARGDVGALVVLADPVARALHRPPPARGADREAGGDEGGDE